MLPDSFDLSSEQKANMNILYISGIAAFAVQCILFFRWLVMRLMDDKIHRVFVRDMAVNHLPHVYSALRKIAKAQNLELDDPPAMQWVDLDGKDR